VDSRCANVRLDLAALHESSPSLGPGRKKRARSVRVIETRMSFSDTELKVTAVDVATGQLVNVAVDFFNA